MITARIDSGFPSLLVLLHDIAEGSDDRFELIEEKFEAFLLVLRVGVHSSSHNRLPTAICYYHQTIPDAPFPSRGMQGSLMEVQTLFRELTW